MRHEMALSASSGIALEGHLDEVSEPVRTRFGRRVSLHRVVVGIFALDCLLLVAAGGVSLWLSGELNAGFTDAAINKLQVIAFGLVLLLASQRLVGGYRSRHVLAGGHSLRRLMLSLFITFSLLMLIGAATKVTQNYSHMWFFSWLALSVLVLPFGRWLALARLRRELAEGAYVRRALSVAYGCKPLSSVAISGLSQGLARAPEPLILADIRDLHAIEKHIREEQIEDVYLAVRWQEAPEAFKALKRLGHLSANVYVLPSIEDDVNVLGARLRGGELLVHVLDRPIEGWNSGAKRLSDIGIAMTALVLFMPVMVLTAIAIKLTSRGPVLFRQVRRGFNGRDFELLKFRSMFASKTDADAERQTSRNDDRVTTVGRFIRRASIDELPQLFNVLSGEMSIVGPRPHALKTKAGGWDLGEAAENYAARHRVKPGMTGWAQVNGMRGELDSIEKLRRRLEYDMDYISRWSIGFDLWIILQTFALLLRDSKAY